jgi:curved DNA-binding protein
MPTTTDFKDYYVILGVDKSATLAEIKRAYRKLARQYHPDLNPENKDAAAKFIDLNEANEVLSDVEKRQKYDQFGQNWNQPMPPESARSHGRATGSPTDFAEYGSFDAFINDLLGRQGRSQRHPASDFNDFGNGFHTAAPAPDTEAAIVLTFAEAFHGVQKHLQLDEETIHVRIPAGATPGRRIRIKGKGRPSPFSQQRGDLYLTIDLLPHSFFRFEGDHLTCEVPIRPDEAVLGAHINVPTPNGHVVMKVPAGVKSGQSLRLRGKGWTLPKGGHSDLFAKLLIVTPQTLTPIEQECYEKIQANASFNPRAHLEEVKL